jgi:erythromycin esterase-like protein
VLPGATLDELRLAVRTLTDGEAGDYDALLKLIGEPRVVLLGVSSQGTHELFRARAELTTRLIKDKGFIAVAIPADPAAVRRLDSFVRGRTEDALASDALTNFTPFPTWVWRNAEMLDFLGWLRDYNDHFSGDAHKVCMQPVEQGLVLEGSQKTVVWEHSLNAGDARATDQEGPSIGQLARQRHRRLAVLVSFSTYAGTTIAAPAPDQAPKRVPLPPARADSVEALCHAIEIPRFYLPLRDLSEHLAEALRAPRPERIVNAVYGQDRYVLARLADQFDALVHFDETRSVEPLDATTMTRLTSSTG